MPTMSIIQTKNNGFGPFFNLKCYPINFIKKFNNTNENKMILPMSILEKINNHSSIKMPLIFKLVNNFSGKTTHCGVLEFTSDEGCAYIPYWAIKKLSFLEGETLLFKYVNLEKGNYVKIQPQTSAFWTISNPRAILETTLRTFACIGKKDIIMINYNSKFYWLNIIDVKPGDLVSIFETDLDVDFDNPMDMK